MRYERYRKTEIPWLPEVPEEWEVNYVGHFFDIQLGKMLCSNRLKDDYSLEPYFCAANVHFEGGADDSNLKEMWFSEDEKKCYAIEIGDLLIVEGGAGAGGSAIVRSLKQPAYMQNSILRLRSRGMVENCYLCYLLEMLVKAGYIEYATNKATIPHFTKEKIFKVPCIKPPLPTQRAIVAFLDEKCGKVDRLVAAKQKEVSLLKELKQSIIAEAVTGKVECGVRSAECGVGDFNTEAQRRRARREVNLVKTNRPTKPSGIPWLPEVPEGWEVIRNKAFLNLTSEKVGSRKNEFPLLSLTKKGVIIRDISEGGKFPKDFDSYLVVRPNDLVFCLFDIEETPRTVGLVRNVGMLTGAYTNFEVNQSVVLPEFAYYYYLFVDDGKRLAPYYTGLRKVVKTNTFLSLLFPLPPLPEQKAIVAYIETRAAKIDAAVAGLEREIAALKEYRERLITDVVTGVRRVRKAECGVRNAEGGMRR